MPKDGLTPEVEKWARQMLQHFNLGDPTFQDAGSASNRPSRRPNEVQPENSRVRVSRNPLHNAQRQAAQFIQDYDNTKSRYENLSAKAKQVSAQTRKVLYSDDLKSSYQAVEAKLQSSLQKLDKNFRQFEPTAAHVSFLKTWMDKADAELTELENVQKQGRDHAKTLIDAEMVHVLSFQKTVEKANADHATLTNANIDLSRLEKALASATALLQRLQKSAKDYNLPALLALKKWLKGTAIALEKSLQATQKEAETLKSKLQERLSNICGGLSELKKKQQDQAEPADQQQQISAEITGLEREISACELSLQSSDCRSAAATLDHCETLLFSIQKLWLQSTQEHELETDEGKRGISTLKKVQNLEDDLERAVRGRELVHNCSPHGSDFDNICQELRSRLLQAQADLIAGKTQQVEDAIVALRKLRFQLYGWTLNAQSKLEWSQNQLTRLRQEAQPFHDKLSGLKIIGGSNELAASNYESYEELLQSILKDIETSSAFLQKEEATAAQPLLQSISLRLRKLPKLAALIEVD